MNSAGNEGVVLPKQNDEIEEGGRTLEPTGGRPAASHLSDLP